MISEDLIFNITSENDFNTAAIAVFKHQFEHNKVYRSFCDLLYKHPSEVSVVQQIPFLPIQFFKTHSIVSNSKSAEATFTSSGTTGSSLSKHFGSDLKL